MITRFKILAAALGLAVAAGAATDASAYTVTKTVITDGVVAKKVVKIIPGRLHRAGFYGRTLAPVRIVRPLPVRAAFVAPHRVVVGSRFVRVTHHPFVRPALIGHRGVIVR